ncbi:MAG: outer membrane protein [Thermodesulfobacteriota bacterium]
MFYLSRFTLIVLFAVLAFSPASHSQDNSKPFDGFYGGLDAAFVSNKTEGTVGPLMVNIVPTGFSTLQISPSALPFGGTDKLPGGSLFAGYGKSVGRFFASLELAGSYGGYDDTKAFDSPHFDSDIDVTAGFLGASARLGFLLSKNFMVYGNGGVGRNWIEAEGTVRSAAIPIDNAAISAALGGQAAFQLPLGQPVKTDLTFDGISFGGGLEYALENLLGLEGVRVRVAYTRVEQGEESFSYADGFSGRNLADLDGDGSSNMTGIDSIEIASDSVPAKADASVNVISFGLLYSL